MSGAALGLATHPFVGVGVRLAVVGELVQVQGPIVTPLAYRGRQVGGQSVVEPSLELRGIGQIGFESLTHGLIGGSVQLLADAMNRQALRRRGRQDTDEALGRTLSSIVTQAQMLAEPVGQMSVDMVAGEGIVTGVHSSVLSIVWSKTIEPRELAPFQAVQLTA